jgi:hypothetical protein
VPPALSLLSRVLRGPVPLLVLFLVGCGGPPVTAPTPHSAESVGGAELGDTIRLARGQGVVVDGGGLSLRFDGVVADDRCPEEVTCVWAGNARIRLGARSHSADETLVPVDTHPLLAHTTPIGDYLVTLEGLEPHPVQSREPDFDRYVAILRVERAAAH